MTAGRRRRGRRLLIRVQSRTVELPLHISLCVVKSVELGLARKKILRIVNPRPRKGRLPNRRRWAKVPMERACTGTERPRSGTQEHDLTSEAAANMSATHQSTNETQFIHKFVCRTNTGIADISTLANQTNATIAV